MQLDGSEVATTRSIAKERGPSMIDQSERGIDSTSSLSFPLLLRVDFTRHAVPHHTAAIHPYCDMSPRSAQHISLSIPTRVAVQPEDRHRDMKVPKICASRQRTLISRSSVAEIR